ncbi:MAG: hypothetical protein KBT46_08440 [Ruminococcus sp.]|nr:hypothetical protein [Candidatus Copronaster equi]
MDTVKQWTIGIAVSAVVGTVILFLTPKGATEKTVRTCVALVLLCAVMTPFMSGIDFDSIFIKTKNPEKIDTAEIESHLAQQTKIALKEKIEEILDNNGIISAKINIDISMNENREMRVEKFEIFADEKYKNNFKKAEDEIKSLTGIDVNIGVKK